MNKNLIILREFRRNNRLYYECKCVCGKIFSARKDNIISGHTNSCGCLSSRNGNNLLNKKFNHLTVIEKTDRRSANGGIYWKCQCDCSNQTIVEVDSQSLVTRKTQSCGCLTSKGEEIIAKLLTSYNISFEKQKTFSDCRFTDSNYPAKFDFYVNNTYIIEYDGIQHYQNVPFFNKDHQDIIHKDNYKTKWCKENNIPLIRIPYNHLSKIEIDDLLLERSVYIV